MKKRRIILSLFTLAFAACFTVGLTACGKKHTHAFTEQKTEAAYLKSAATCTEAAVYYKSCTCGEKGTETFTSGNALGHTDRYTTNNDGTHKHDCSVCNAVLEASVACSGGTATCTEKAVCEVCHVQYGEVDANNHAGGVATCTQKAVCERCREEYGELDPNIHAYTGGICGDCGELQTKGLAYTPSSDGTYYTVSKGDCTDTEIHILAMYDGKPVTSIGSYAFQFCSRLTSIEIPSSVTSIRGGAFEGCAGLTSITIPSSVTSIGYNAFEDCRGLTSIEIPSSVTSIGSRAFYGCSGLRSIEIPSSVTSIGIGAFGSCSGLTSITVASGNTKYHSDGNCIIETQSRTLVVGCKTSVIPTDGSVTSIGNSAFSYCRGLTSIEIPNGVTSIGDYAFEGCSGLTSIEIPSSVTSIGSYRVCYNSTIENKVSPSRKNEKHYADIIHNENFK